MPCSKASIIYGVLIQGKRRFKAFFFLLLDDVSIINPLQPPKMIRGESFFNLGIVYYKISYHRPRSLKTDLNDIFQDSMFMAFFNKYFYQNLSESFEKCMKLMII